MTGVSVQVFKGSGRHPWYVRAVSGNGQVMTTSEGYFSKFNANRAARRMFPLATLRELERWER